MTKLSSTRGPFEFGDIRALCNLRELTTDCGKSLTIPCQQQSAALGVMRTYENERQILTFFEPLLRELYGEFSIDPLQEDAPDAAIVLSCGPGSGADRCRPRIGIEITTVDKPKDLQYRNDKKRENQIRNEQQKRLFESGEYSRDPVKALLTSVEKSYVRDGVSAKAAKYASYGPDNFQELIVAAFSEIVDFDHPDVHDYLTRWTQYLLSKDNYPFDKVLFCSPQSGRCAVVYERKSEDLSLPPDEKEPEVEVENRYSSTLPMGLTVDISGLLDGSRDPLVPRKRPKR